MNDGARFIEVRSWSMKGVEDRGVSVKASKIKCLRFSDELQTAGHEVHQYQMKRTG